MKRQRLLVIFEKVLVPLISISIGLGAALVIATILGESPVKVLGILLEGAFGNNTQIGYSLYYATPLLFTGLSVAWAFRVGLFNIGGEGQMMLGGVAMAALGIAFPNLPAVVALPMILFVGFFVGGAWGALAGWFKAKRGCHEVLSSILLNFISYSLCSFLILHVLKNPDSQSPETAPIGVGFELPVLGFGGTSPVNASIFLAVLAAFAFWFVFAKTKFGFVQRMSGEALQVARRAGVSVDKQIIFAMFLSGGLAGLGGISQILGYLHKAKDGFPAGAGFMGIAVALLGRNSAIGVLLASLLFGVLTQGALNLDLDTEKVSRDLAVVIQAFIVLSVASQVGLQQLFKTWVERRREP